MLGKKHSGIDTAFDTFAFASLYYAVFFQPGQVAQLVERGPEKAGVGGSIPSLATINPRKSLAKF